MYIDCTNMVFREVVWFKRVYIGQKYPETRSDAKVA